MCLIYDDRIVGLQQRILLRFHQQNAVGHNLENGLWRGLIIKTDLVTDGATDLLTQLFGKSPCNRGGRDPSRLRTSDPSGQTPSGLETHLWNLRRFSGPGLPGHDHDGMSAHGRNDLVSLIQNRQARRIDDSRHLRPPLTDMFFRADEWHRFHLPS